MASNWQEAHEVLTSCPGVEVKITNKVLFHCIPTCLPILNGALPFRPSLLPSPFLGLSRGLPYVKNILQFPGEHEELAIASAKRLVGLVQMIIGSKCILGRYIFCLGYRRFAGTDLSMMTNCMLERSSELLFRKCHWLSLFKAVFLS